MILSVVPVARNLKRSSWGAVNRSARSARVKTLKSRCRFSPIAAVGALPQKVLAAVPAVPVVPVPTAVPVIKQKPVLTTARQIQKSFKPKGFYV